jgi:hypothetical protein
VVRYACENLFRSQEAMIPRPPFFGASIALVAALLGSASCSANGKTTSASGTAGGNGGNGGDGFTFGGSGGGANGPLQQEPSCDGIDPGIDNDGDGWTGAAGDCNDCTWQMNPGAQDYPGNAIDEDCNGTADDSPTNCDGGLGLASGSPLDGARAMGLCKMAHSQSWGVLSAKYITADGQPLEELDTDKIGWGILPDFGPNVKPQEGAQFLVLSSGTARRPGDPGYDGPAGHDKLYETGSPPGYPKESPACPKVITGDPHDSAGLRVVIKSPTNATSLSFNLDFYTYEFPKYICDVYNDFFVAMLTPKPSNQVDGNISYDGMGNTISVNAGFLQVCHPQAASNGAFFDCLLGPGQLAGTGFDLDAFGETATNSAATGWLRTSTPLDKPGQELTIDFAVWDSGDGVLDSTILIDNFQFGLDNAPTQTTPIPDPK